MLGSEKRPRIPALTPVQNFWTLADFSGLAANRADSGSISLAAEE
jgi:hypothetical protein